MFQKVLIANRGEIALRVIRACRELGLETVAVYSEADRESLHVRFADDDVCIGPPPARDSYLNIPRLIAAAEITGADAIHPGYGFLAENAEFAEICAASKITFIGPTADQIRTMGDKAQARKTMSAVGVPIIPGTPGPVEDVDEALTLATQIGFPVIIKAAAGGGGKGMRVAKDPDDFGRSFQLARSEALSAFGNGDVYVEKYLTRPRHIEFQILGDRHGNILHLGERDCSVQRRHQKLIEESPSPAVDGALRETMGSAAVAGAKAIDYVGATSTVQLGIDSTIKGGHVVVVGLIGGEITISTPLLPQKALKLQGSYVGSLSELREFMYWLFKYRVRMCEPARVASDTRKALAQLSAMEDAVRRSGRRASRARVEAEEVVAE